MRKFGPIEIVRGWRVAGGTEFDVVVFGEAVTILVEVHDDRVSAHVTQHAAAPDPGPLTMPVSFLATPDGGYSGNLTLPAGPTSDGLRTVRASSTSNSPREVRWVAG
jgi:hypothetical protein